MPDAIRYNAWSEDLYRPHGSLPFDYMLVDGGRGSSKTFEITRALVIKGHQQPLRICIGREHLKSIDESAKIELEGRIRELGLLRPDCYRISKTNIDHENGTHILFIGMSKMSEEDIKGLSMVDICWLEEAHKISHSSWELLVPTIRKEQAQIWVSWNPRYRTDAISKFLSDNRKDPMVWHKHITFRDNAYFTSRNERERVRYENKNPERYGHMWEGAFDDVSEKRKVLPFALLQACMDAWPKRPRKGAYVDAGLDVADTGEDANSLALRSGPELRDIRQWHGSIKFTVSDTARRAKKICDDEGVTRLRYDAGGVGAGIRGPIREARPKVQYPVTGYHFGSKPQAPDVLYLRGRRPATNGEYFFNWAAQAGWNLRIRADRTQRFIKGEPVDPHECLFINPDIDRIDDVLAELAQPEWDDSTGKLKIDKQPRDAGESKPLSPNAYDSTILAFSSDCRKGLRSGR